MIPGDRTDTEQRAAAHRSPPHVPLHPVPVYDPGWLRRSHSRCLWDGAIRPSAAEFCTLDCEERYSAWEHTTSHHVAGREPLATFLDPGVPAWDPNQE